MSKYFESLFDFSLFITFLFALSALGTFASHDHSIKYYYTGIDSGQTNTTCVFAYRQWWMDDRSFCSDDINKVLDVMKKLNEARGK